jgi:exodeoxyribonuclease V alpha subunit
MTTLDGHLERITYYNRENHFTIAKFRTDKTNNLITVLGYIPNPNLGESLKIYGNWETHARYGQQLKIEHFEVVLPTTTDGIKKYLKSGVIKGLGPKTATRLVDHFKEKTFEIIEKDPARLLEIKGIGKATSNLIIKAWKENHAIKGLIQFLQENRINTSYSSKIYNKYGSEAVNIIRNDPFRITKDIPGIGFIIADTVAQNMGTSKNEPNRVKACIIHLLEQGITEGHIFLYEDKLIRRCMKIFHIERDAAESAIAALADEQEVVIEQDEEVPYIKAVYPKILHEAETVISNRLKALLSVPSTIPDIDLEQITSEVLKKLAIKLSSEQLSVLEGIISYHTVIITGGPGTGKTTLIRSINSIFDLLGKKVLLAAPTGRAARRLSEVTQRNASTIHKLLGFNLMDGAFNKNQDNPLNTDALIIDEASMIDTLLMYHLIKAVPMTAVIILVGDVFQLPSVGPGNILSDLIKSNRIKTFKLNKIFRQDQESPIVINAHKIRRGELPDLIQTNGPEELSEFYFIEQNNPGMVVNTIVELCSKRIPNIFNFDSMNDIQVLTPMHRGEVGTSNLNQVLQKVLNPNPVIMTIQNNAFKLGDKVMHLKNNYQKEVFNGDIGKISFVDKKKEELTVNYYGRDVAYDFSELEELTLAYAISVHKSQGSEYIAVIVPIMTQHFALLQRNLLYTAITRGKKLVVLIGTKKALAIALKNDKPRKRLSGLAKRLME